jgi:hypothetical protein
MIFKITTSWGADREEFNNIAEIKKPKRHLNAMVLKWKRKFPLSK